MKATKGLMVIMAAAMITIGLSGASYAFHDGGVATCDSCHTMHNASGTTGIMGGHGVNAQTGFSYKGAASQFSGNAYLLQGSDQSSTCLNCHAVAEATGGSYHIMSPDAVTTGLPTHFTPGGDFGWLLATPASASSSYDKSRRGHNINAADWGLGASAGYAITLQTAPGGTYPQANLHCSSCHDPHGTYRHTTGDPTQTTDIKSSVFSSGFTGSTTSSISGSGSYGVLAAANSAVGVYRLLAGVGYAPTSVGPAYAFAKDSPVAISPSNYDIVASTFGIASGQPATTEVVVQYGKGMSEWCQNCHTNIKGGMGALIHPAGTSDGTATLGIATAGSNTIATNYNAYVGSGNLTGVNLYSSLVPVEGVPLVALANTTTTTVNSAPTVTGSQSVSCLSCHKAHATAWTNMTRFDVGAELTTVAGNYLSNDLTPGQRGVVYSSAQYKNAMDGRPSTVFAANQRVLCNKCHAKD
jgi:hypothetical protein